MDGQFSIFDYTHKNIEVKNPIRLIELFAGYGSQAMALRNLGAEFEHYRVIELDKYAMASYNAIHGTNFEPTDICEVRGGNLGIVDMDKYTYLLTYSFPCTDISLAGRGAGMAEGSGTRSSLLWEVKRVLSELQEIGALPQVLLMENVTAIHSKDNKPHFRKWLDFLDSLGYSTYIEDLNAADYGIAQNRDRTFALSILGEYNYKFPEPIELTTCIDDYLEELTEEQALQYIVKSDKARDLLIKLDEENKLD